MGLLKIYSFGVVFLLCKILSLICCCLLIVFICFYVSNLLRMGCLMCMLRPLVISTLTITTQMKMLLLPLERYLKNVTSCVFVIPMAFLVWCWIPSSPSPLYVYILVAFKVNYLCIWWDSNKFTCFTNLSHLASFTSSLISLWISFGYIYLCLLENVTYNMVD